jgi:heterodisulfide reductase subunit D
MDFLRIYGNPFGRDLSSVFNDEVPPAWVEPEAQVLVFPGCATPAYNPGVLGDLVRLLEALGIDVVGFLPPEPLCCGRIHLELGDEEGFRRAATLLFRKVWRAKRILTLCPHCLHALKARYDWLDPTLGNRVEHITQFLLAYLPRFQPAAARVLGPLVYHDPCYLARYLGVYDPPRALLQEVLPEDGLLEFPRHRQLAECCGGGGGLPLTFPEDAVAIAGRRLRWLPKQDVPVATSCPWCVGLFREARPEDRVFDVISVLATALET